MLKDNQNQLPLLSMLRYILQDTEREKFFYILNYLKFL